MTKKTKEKCIPGLTLNSDLSTILLCEYKLGDTEGMDIDIPGTCVF